MEDDVSSQLEQVRQDIAALEERLRVRDAPDREAIARLAEERRALSSQLTSATQTEAMLQAERSRAADRLSEVETREARLGAMGTVERLVVAGWSFIFIAIALLLVFDLTLLVVRDALGVGLLAALLFAGLGWGLAVVVRSARRG